MASLRRGHTQPDKDPVRYSDNWVVGTVTRKLHGCMIVNHDVFIHKSAYVGAYDTKEWFACLQENDAVEFIAQEHIESKNRWRALYVRDPPIGYRRAGSNPDCRVPYGQPAPAMGCMENMMMMMPPHMDNCVPHPQGFYGLPPPMMMPVPPMYFPPMYTPNMPAPFPPQVAAFPAQPPYHMYPPSPVPMPNPNQTDAVAFPASPPSPYLQPVPVAAPPSATSQTRDLCPSPAPMRYVPGKGDHAAFSRIWMLPRVLVNVEDIDTSCEMLGAPCSLPIYITGTALGRLYHEDGEMCLTRAAYEQGIVQMCPTLASCTMDEMVSAKRPGQHQWWQLYVNRDREVTKKVIKKAEQAGMEALFITVDAPQLGRRERDMRHKTEQQADVQSDQADEVKKDEGVTRAISTFIDPSLNWDSLQWFKETTNLPILLKGVQCAADALLAVEHGMDGIVCSNHGGRQIDTCRSGVEVLEEVIVALKERKVDLSTFHVYVDGGIRRGTDIFKCMALGAKGCGLGRPFLYGIAAYGQDGAEKVCQLLRAELEMCMRLMGTPSIKDIRRDMVTTRNLQDHFAMMPQASLPEANLSPMMPILSSNM